MSDGDHLISEILKDTIREPGLNVLHLKVEEDTIVLDNIPHHPIKIKENFLKRL